MPPAATVKVTGLPTVTTWADGCVVMDGATGMAVTVRSAGLLSTLPAALDTVTVIV